MNKINEVIEQCLNICPCQCEIRYNEPMKEHTTFKVGGPADIWLQPKCSNFKSFCTTLLNCAKKNKVSVFILGGGANIVVSDKGIRGIVLDINAFKGQVKEEKEFVVKSGTTMDEICEIAAASGFGGLEFLSGMPGTIGGAIWMNARCYGSEIADVLSWVEIIENNKLAESEFNIKRIEIINKNGFEYKKSPFQDINCLILNAAFKINKDDKEKIYIKMKKNKQDRKDKGHYLFPSAGSAFKNNRDFGKPAGQIIDESGLKGLQIGGAQVAPFHGNIINNKENAKALDIHAIMDEIVKKVKTDTGFDLEPEILFAGQW